MENDLKVIGGSSHPELARKICEHLGIRQTPTEIVRFSNENMLVKINENVREKDVFVIQTSITPVSDNILETFLMFDALKNSSAARITAVFPYYPYVRSDKKDQPRISIAARLMADLCKKSGANRLLTMDLHSSQIQGFFSFPSDQLFAYRTFCDYFKQRDLQNYVVVAADVGETKHLGVYANRLNLPIAIVDKRREGNDESPIPTNLIGDVEGKHALIIDDEVASGGTLVKASEFLIENGASSVSAAIVHPVLSGEAMRKIENSCIEELVITDTIPLSHHPFISKKVKQLTVSELFAKAIERIHDGRSVSDLIN